MPHNTVSTVPSEFSPVDDEGNRIQDIISALDYLRTEAKKTGDEDVYNLIDATFTICLNTFCIVKRHELGSILRNGS